MSSAKRRKVEAWICDSCTFLNEGDGTVCTVCEVARGLDSGAGWTCHNCTLENASSQKKCAACELPCLAVVSSRPGPSFGNMPLEVGSEGKAGPCTSGPSAPAFAPHAPEGSNLEDQCWLDTCGCSHSRLQLCQSLLQACREMDSQKDVQSSCIHCSCCKKTLLWRDLQTFLPAASQARVSQAIFKAALGKALEVRPAEALKEAPLPPPPEATCPFCPTHPAMIPITGPCLLTVAQLRAALTARDVKPARLKAACLQQLRGACHEATAACLSCDGMRLASSGLCIRLSDQRQENVDHNSGSGRAQNKPSDSGNAPAAAPQQGPSKGNQKQLRQKKPKKAKKPKRNSGTGYGGEGADDDYHYHYNSHPSWDQQPGAEARAAAQKREQEADTEVAARFAQIQSMICDSKALTASGAPALPLDLCAILRAGPVKTCLRLLLQNDSLMDIGSRAELYQATINLLRCLGSWQELVTILAEPADSLGNDPEPETRGSDPVPSVLSALAGLDQQCRIYKRSAAELADSEEDIELLSLALDVSSLLPSLQTSLESMRHLEARAAAAVEVGAAAMEAAGGAANGQPVPSQPASEQPLELRYKAALKPLQFTDHKLVGGDYYFDRDCSKTGGGGEIMKKRLRRLTQEMSTLSTSLPLSLCSSVLIAHDESRLDVYKALIFGPDPDTPYANGCFIFDIYLPPSYPSVPPKVQFLTTGGGRARFNPNLYNCGKVCLSLLGTWSGPSWDAAQSTLLQVLISIQSMIFVSDPYYNEPGYEHTRNTAGGQQASRAYDEEQQFNTMMYAILPALAAPCPAFADAIREHFTLKASAVEECCSKWVAGCSNKGLQKQMKTALADIKKGLKALSKGKGPAQPSNPLPPTASAPAPSYLSQIINLFE
ncbi:hypothetical protein WJX74_007107 [Apatococcus lobatus]|uniref:UBC core domain-containing protein n=1 Tax=Apatococcus lobatus TaxID=904363 RepID=A0AAW1QJS2_9CHLO